MAPKTHSSVGGLLSLPPAPVPSPHPLFILLSTLHCTWESLGEIFFFKSQCSGRSPNQLNQNVWRGMQATAALLQEKQLLLV